MHWVLTNRGIFWICILFTILFSLSNYFAYWFPVFIPAFVWTILIVFAFPSALFFLIVIATPLSINFEELAFGGIGFYFPTEPLLFGFLILLLAANAKKRIFKREVLNHPVTQILFIYLAWLFITSLLSVRPVVSMKFLLAKLWYIIPVYLLGLSLFLDKKNIFRFVNCYLVPLAGVVIYTLIRHYQNGFAEQPAHWVMEPFYKDHTQYGAVVSIFIPISLGLFLITNKSTSLRYVYLSIFILLSVGLIFSYSRAAWISSLAILTILFIIWVRVPKRILLLGFVVSGIFLLTRLDNLMMALEKNKTDSSENLVENVESITNISTDASNLERLNRWNCAIGMFKEKPIFGWGPGTYMFEYAPFQLSKDLTIISTNFADVGNAHSEYLSALAESGLIGALIFMLLIYTVFKTATRAYRKSDSWRTRTCILFVTLGLGTYFIHGFLNNFLDSDKASVPVWGLIAVIVAYDLMDRSSKTSSAQNQKQP